MDVTEPEPEKSKGHFMLLPFDEDRENKTEGYGKLVANAEFNLPDRPPHRGWISTCVDARIPYSKIRSLMDDRELITTAGNAYPSGLDDFGFRSDTEQSNVLITHGIHPDKSDGGIAYCGGHSLAYSSTMNQSKDDNFGELITNLEGQIMISDGNFDPFGTAQRLGKLWQAEQIYLYDHTSGELLDVFDDNVPLDVGVEPKTHYENTDPSEGQDPHSIIINTTGIPYFQLAKRITAREIGGTFEIFYPTPQLPEETIQSLIFAVKSHIETKKSDQSGDFASTRTIILTCRSKNDLNTLVTSLINSKHSANLDYIYQFTKDQGNEIIGLIPGSQENETEIYSITLEKIDYIK